MDEQQEKKFFETFQELSQKDQLDVITLALEMVDARKKGLQPPSAEEYLLRSILEDVRELTEESRLVDLILFAHENIKARKKGAEPPSAEEYLSRPMLDKHKNLSPLGRWRSPGYYFIDDYENIIVGGYFTYDGAPATPFPIRQKPIELPAWKRKLIFRHARWLNAWKSLIKRIGVKGR